MNEPAYPAARQVAARLHRHFSMHRSAAEEQGRSDLAPLPTLQIIEGIIDAAFWTSLRREENHPPRISLAFLPPEQASPTLLLENPLPLLPASMTRIAPGVERAGIHLGVWMIDGELRVWGATRNLPALAFVVETVAPGILVVKHRWSDEKAKFINVAVLEGDQIKVLDDKFPSLPGCHWILGSLLGSDLRAPGDSNSSSVIIRLAISMREHRRGGLLLLVRNSTETWRESIAHPISYSVQPPYSGLADIVREVPETRSQRSWREALLRSVDGVAGLTAIDGATVITDDFQVLGFGAKIVRRKGSHPVEEVILTEPTEGAAVKKVHPVQLGGTRHLSAAQFVHDQRDALAFVASQDGPFTIFAWSECDNSLYGYRVESLLL